MLESIKFEVPFSIPAILVILLAASSSLKILIIGVPAHTADSNNIFTLFLLAQSNISSPW